MKFVAPERAEIIKNTPFWPDVALPAFRRVMRTYGTVTRPHLKQALLMAMAEVNAELFTFRERQQQLGYQTLAEVPAASLKQRNERIRHYHNAIHCCARAVLHERYSSASAMVPGLKHGKEQAVASGGLWREARRAISRVRAERHRSGEVSE